MNAASFGHALEQGFAWTWHTSLYASVLIVLVWAVQGVLGKRLSPGWRCAFGILVVARLLIPATPATHFSVFNVTRSVFRPELRPAAPTIQSAQVPTFQPPTAHEVALPNIPDPPHRRLSTKAAIELAWLAGCAGILFVALAQQLRMAAWARRQKPVSDPRAIALLQSCRRLFRLRREVRILIAPQLGTPAVFGFFKPCLLLPEGILERQNAAELRLIFLHELAHIRRGDVLFNWAVILSRSLHWFNPLAWLALNRFRADQEMACDAQVLSHLTMDERRLYGNTLLDLLGHFSGTRPYSSLASFIHKKSGIERRINMITNLKPPGRTASLVCALGFLLIGALTFTRAAIQNPPTAPENGRVQQSAEIPIASNGPDSYETSQQKFKEFLSQIESQIANAQARVDQLCKELSISTAERASLTEDPLTLMHYLSFKIENEAALAKDRKQLDQLLEMTNMVDLGLVISTLPDPLLQELRQKLVDAQGAVTGLNSNASDQNPDVIRTRQLVDELTLQVDQRVKGMMVALNARAQAEQAMVDETEKKIKEIEANESSRAEQLRPYFKAKADLERLKKISEIIAIRADQAMIEAAVPASRPLKIIVAGDGSLRMDPPYDSTPTVTLDRLKSILVEQRQKNPNMKLLISAGKAVSFGDMVKVIDAAKEVKIGNISLRTE